MNLKIKKVASMAVVAAILMAVPLTGCGNKENTKPSSNNLQDSTQKISKPLAMRMAYLGSELETMTRGIDYALKKAKERFNIDLKIDYMDKNTFNNKINVVIASGEIPDVFPLTDAGKISQAIQSQMFIPLTDVVENDPEWKKVNQRLLKAGFFKGEYYSLVNVKNLPDTLYFREDWAKKLNIKTPTNQEELYQMLYAFTRIVKNNN